MVTIRARVRNDGRVDHFFVQLLEAPAQSEGLHDRITGLPTRALFLDRLSLAIRRLPRGGAGIALMLIDLDGLARVNEVFGRSAGDEVLATAARRLKRLLRSVDSIGRATTVARAESDEFLALCEGVDNPQASATIAQRLAHALASPISINGEQVKVTATVGVAISASTAEPLTLLRETEAAMYQAKLHGSRVEVFDHGAKVRDRERLETEKDLHGAVGRDEFRLVFQPVIDLRTGAPVGAESLVRWQHPRRGLLPPGAFIEIAEGISLIGEMGEWVLTKACQHAQHWRAAAWLLDVAVNVSPRQLYQVDLVERVQSVLDASALAPEAVSLEITETVLMHDAFVARRTLRDLKSLGIRVEVDDFGTGYSSLSYLRRFPVDGLKIDRSFIEELEHDRDVRTIVRAIVDLAHSLGLRVIGEGIETLEQLAVLTELGCDLGQGYLWSRPVSAVEFEAWLTAHAA